MIRLERRGFNLSSKLAGILAAVAIGLGLPFVQAQTKSKIEQELERKDAVSKKSESNKGASTATRSVGASSKSRAPAESTITIISDLPDVEVSIDGTPAGKTDETRKLTTKVKRGQHKVTASLKGYYPQSSTISVFANKSTHSISVGKPLPPPVPVSTPVSKAEPTPEAAPAPPPPSADDIIRRFINPKETKLVGADDWNEVIAQSEASLKTEPGNAQARGRLHLARGQAAYLKWNYAESLSEFNRAIEVLPLSGVAYFGLGNTYLITNQPLQAQKAYQRAIDLTPEVAAIAQKGIGDSLSKQAKRGEANSAYVRARDLGYLSPELNKSIAVNLIQEKQWQKALAELKAIEVVDTSADVQLYMGECYENLKRMLSAYRAYSAAIKLDPSSPVAFSRLGNLLFDLNEFPEAKEAYEHALALDTTGATINRQLIRKQADRAASLAKQ